MLHMMLRPRWIAALVLALAISAAFALLGQWQIERAIESSTTIEYPTEDVVALTDVAEPDGPTAQAITGQRVSVEGSFVPTDFSLVEGRLNLGEAGWWVLGHLETDAGGLPIALGWAPTEADAQAALAELEAETPEPVEFLGRFLPSEAPVKPEEGADPQSTSTVAVAQLINQWEGFDDRPVYFGYVISDDAPAGLTAIDAPPPEQEVDVNWLNIFYAVEWVVFAGFAIFLWYRLVRDAVEREQEEAELAAADAATAAEKASVDAG
jgi:cytochrome oxidase assembly protein ShyY1